MAFEVRITHIDNGWVVIIEEMGLLGDTHQKFFDTLEDAIKFAQKGLELFFKEEENKPKP